VLLNGHPKRKILSLSMLKNELNLYLCSQHSIPYVYSIKIKNKITQKNNLKIYSNTIKIKRKKFKKRYT